ncbi:MAG: hypothetical protein WBO97_13265, partial [Tepidiformaceae bacterium]
TRMRCTATPSSGKRNGHLGTKGEIQQGARNVESAGEEEDFEAFDLTGDWVHPRHDTVRDFV